MKTQSWKRLAGAVACVSGLVLSVLTHGPAVAQEAPVSAQIAYSGSLLLFLAGMVCFIALAAPNQKPVQVRTLTTAALFAALCYLGFAVFRIDIPVGTEKTAFHLGNVFCVLAALFLGGLWGGMAGAVGMTIADLTSGYVTSAPKTFLLKLCIGLIAGLVSQRVFHLRQEGHSRRYTTVATVVSCAAGMAFNIVADPVVGYFYKRFVLGVPQEVATVWAKIGATTTMVNAVIAVVVASVFYLSLRPALKHANLMQ